jgi:hypothetical protein
MTTVAAIQAAWSDYTLNVQAEDRDTIDQSTQSNPYLSIEIAPLTSDQADMSAHPLVKQRGQIVIYVVSKEGTGTVIPNKLIDFIIPYFDMKVLGTVRCHAAGAYKAKPIAGWRWAPILVNYFFHRVST